MKCIYVYNKIDVIGIDDVDKLARQPNSVVISCNLKVDFNNTIFYFIRCFVIIFASLSSQKTLSCCDCLGF